MMGGLKVLNPGLLTTVQDLGRHGFQDVGVPVSGPLDRMAFTLANALVGNPDNTPALEMILQGVTFDVTIEAARLAVVGGEGGLRVGIGGGRFIPSGQSVQVAKGERVQVLPFKNTAAGYLAIEGGIAVPPCLGSASTYIRGPFGGLNGQPLKAGDFVPLAVANVSTRPELALDEAFDPRKGDPIRVVLGPQQDYFSDAAIASFLSTTYIVSQKADRMGYRLDGPKLKHIKGYDIVSDSIVTGSIQVPGTGQPIILLADAQTAGGYPKIATVISADISLIGRRGPGSRIRFTAVTQEQAEQIQRDQTSALKRRIANFRPVNPPSEINIGALYESNLIDGVSSGTD